MNNMVTAHFVSKWYTRLIGIFFLLVSFSLIVDLLNFGFRPETMHKIFHVVLGAVVVILGWNNKLWWLPFALINGAFFSYMAFFGWLFGSQYPELDAFNFVDTILHSIVGISGILIGVGDWSFLKKKL